MELSLCNLIILFVLLGGNQKVFTKPFELLARLCKAEDGFFMCNSGQCIHRALVRDSNPSCPDESDESIKPLQCTDDEVLCRSTQRCVLRRFLNTRYSCQLSETINFPCRPDEFQCAKSRICIPRWMVSDGKVDCDSWLSDDSCDELTGFSHCLDEEFRCVSLITEKTRCIPREWVMDGHNDCTNERDELFSLPACLLETEFRCQKHGRCVLRYRVMDGYRDCPDGSDEKHPIECNASKEFRCQDNGRCIPRSWQGNGFVNCKDGSDEIPMHKNESCVEGEFRCHNDRRCIPTYLLCDGMDHCGDCSDEIESCDEPRMFRCPSEPGKCIYWGFSCDTYSDCANGTDDIKMMHGFKCRRDHASTERYCAIPQWMLYDDFSDCDDNSDLCLRENSTSTCTRCLEGRTVLATRQICDGIVDCPDLSDECLCSVELASKPVRAFCERVSYSNSDQTCPLGSVQCQEVENCVRPLSVCNGIADCLVSQADEEICNKDNNTLTGAIEEPDDFKCDPLHPTLQAAVPESLETFVDFFVPLMAKRCNGITECMNFEDECSKRANCSHRLSICDNIPLGNETVPPGYYGITEEIITELRRCGGDLNFAFGKSICNGILECEDGIDERNCSDTRFTCVAGTTEWPTGLKKVVNIPLEKRCDANLPTDCVDQSDEINCTDATHFYCENGDPLFVKRKQVLDGKQDCSDFSDECPKDVFSRGGISSREELISYPALRVMVWIMAFLAIIGNVFVAFVVSKKFHKRTRNPLRRKTKVAITNDVLILNLSMADFLMGVALVCIAVRSQMYKGQYCLFDKQWRTSHTCTALGVIIVLSSQCSVFTLVTLTSYRLYSVLYPIASKQLRFRVLFVWLVIIWLVAFFIALLPLSALFANSMITRAWISSNPYFQSDTIALEPYQKFAMRISALSSVNNVTTLRHHTHWYDIEKYLHEYFIEASPSIRGYFGYYSESAVCIPRLYLTSPDDHDHTPMTYVVMTFNFVALMYIIVAYVLIYLRSTNNMPINSLAQKKTKMLYRKITLLIATDLACWLPICLMTFLSMGKVILPPIAYALSAIVFLPINSSLNPIIYTNPFSVLFKYFERFRDRVRKF